MDVLLEEPAWSVGELAQMLNAVLCLTRRDKTAVRQQTTLVVDFSDDICFGIGHFGYDQSDNIWVLMNDGAGFFVTDKQYQVDSFPRSVSAADLDGDGDLDISLDVLDSGYVSVFLNLDFICGNIDGIIGPAGPVDVADLTYLVAYLFQGARRRL